MAKQSAADRLAQIAAALNERQRAYLLAAYDEDQRREDLHRGPGGRPASEWRWIEYGAVGTKILDTGWNLRRVLEGQGLVSNGTGATWSALEGRALVKLRHARTGLMDARTGRHIVALMVQMTTDGRKVARLLRGQLLTKPKQEKPLSLSALRLIEFGQKNPDAEFEWCAPWSGYVPDFLVMRGIAAGLVKRGLLAGEPPYRLRITDAGKAFDVTAEPNWKPMRVWSEPEI